MNNQIVFEYIDQHIDEHIIRVQDLVKQPSISPTEVGVRDCAELVLKYFDEVGCQKTRLVETAGNPVVVGELDAGAAKTLIAYMMYDTQPIDDPGWTVPPLEARLVNLDPFGRVLMARGAFNSKGPMMGFINACKAIQDAGEQLPVNLIFIAEGEEELGSRNFPEFLKKEERLTKTADYVFFPFLSQDQTGKVQNFLGVKGILYFELEVDGKSWGYGPTEFDIHGSMKCVMDSPTWRLVQALASMTTPDGNKVLIEGFYDTVAPITDEDQKALDELAETFDEASFKELLKIERFMDNVHGYDALKKYLFDPQLNIDGIWSGYIEVGTKTVLPWKATAKVDVRLVPNMQIKDIFPMIRRHLDKKGFKEVKIRSMESGYGWAKLGLNHPLAQAILQSYQTFPYPVENWPTLAGSAPFSLFAQKPFNLPFVVAGLGHGALAHSPNEYIVIDEGGPTGGLATMEKSFVVMLDRISQIKPG
jgi:acetylornithine deacetylase/succinyl-diaminopimelate desuccinylase-like protein